MKFKMSILISIYLVVALVTPQSTIAAVTAQEAQAIAADAYIYAYPLVLMEVTRRVMTNNMENDDSHAPINQFARPRNFINHKDTDIPRIDAATMFATLWFDLSGEPLIIEVPASKGRYYTMEMLDMWSDVFAAPGSRTTGNNKQIFTVAGPNWQGEVPEGATLLRCPTNIGWAITQIEVKGRDDFAKAHRFQDKFNAIPLSKFESANSFQQPIIITDPKQNLEAPTKQVSDLKPMEFFKLFCEITKLNPPHPNDYPILHRMQQIGIIPGKDLQVSDPKIIQALEAAPNLAENKIASYKSTVYYKNGWFIAIHSIGTYGTDYINRKLAASFALSSSTLDEIAYFPAFNDHTGSPLHSDKTYTIHFEKDQMPPVKGFWSLSIFDDRNLIAKTSENHCAISQHSPFKFNPDGSLDFYIQRRSPGKHKTENWIQTPANGNFSLILIMYWPKQSVRTLKWTPPPIIALQ